MTAEPADDVTARELERLAFRYAATLDNRDGPGFAALFAENAVLTMVRRRRDADEVMSSWTGYAELAQIPEGLKRNLRTLHLVGNRLYEFAGDEAAGQVYCVAHHIDDSGAVPIDRVLYIRYRDTYRRADGAPWRFQERFIEIEWSQTSFAEI